MSEAVLHTHRDAGHDAAIVFVHGFLGDPAKTWGNFPRFAGEHQALKKWDVFSLGYPTSAWFDLVGIWRANPDVQGVATSLKTRLTYDVVLSRYKAVALVAHSMGGLAVQRALVDAPSLVERTHAVVLFGTPSNGLSKAVFFGFWKPSLHDMEIDGPFIRTLRRDWSDTFAKERPFAFRTVAGDSDEFVPRASSLEPFAEADREVVPGDHLSIVKPSSADSLSVQIVANVLGGQAMQSAQRAVERTAARATVNRLRPMAAQLDEKGLIELSLAFETVGRPADALETLRNARPEQTDARGVLGGRLKRRWLFTRSEADGREALAIYRNAFRAAQQSGAHADAFYNGINYAFMTLALEGRDGARAIAHEVLAECAAAEPVAGTRLQWLRATEGEAHLYLGDPAAALARYREARELTQSARERDSIFQQAIHVTSILGDQPTALDLMRIFERDR